MTGSYFFLSIAIAYDVPQGDHWEWMHKLLIPFLDGEITFGSYLTGAFLPLEHSHIPTLLFAYMNYSLFDLRYDIECYFGLICTLVLYVFLLTRYLQSDASALGRRNAILCAGALTAVSLNPYNLYTTSLVQFEFFYLLLAVVYLSLYDNLLKEKIRPITFHACTMVIFFIGDAQGMVSILAVLTYMILFSGGKERIRYVAGTVIVLAIGYVIAKFSFTYVGTPRIEKTDALTYVADHLVDAFKFILFGYSQGIVDQHSIIKKVFGSGFYGIALATGFLTLISAPSSTTPRS